MTDAQTIPEQIRTQLSAGEQVLWLGQPPQGLRLLPTAVNQKPSILLLFSPFILGASFMGKMFSGDPRWLLGGIALALIGIVVSLVFDARRRARIHYALTSERVMITGPSRRGRVQSINLLTLPGLSLVEGRDGHGTVLIGFASWLGSAGHDRMTTNWPGMGNNAPPQFSMIADARHVCQMIRDAQRRVWTQQPLELSGVQPASAEAVKVDRIPDAIGAHLSAGEQVLWLGQPRQGLMLRATDAIAVPLTLLSAIPIGGLCWLWLAPLITRKQMRMAHLEVSVFWLIDVVFVILVLMMFYALVGRFFTDAWQRAKSHYALTGERVLIARGTGRDGIQSVNLRTLPDLLLTEGKDGYGTVWLTPAPSRPSMTSGGVSDINTPPHLDTIPDAQRVYQMIRDAQCRLV